jgi:hypothetical protein
MNDDASQPTRWGSSKPTMLKITVTWACSLFIFFNQHIKVSLPQGSNSEHLGAWYCVIEINTGSANLKINHEQANITCYMQSQAGKRVFWDSKRAKIGKCHEFRTRIQPFYMDLFAFSRKSQSCVLPMTSLAMGLCACSQSYTQYSIIDLEI